MPTARITNINATGYVTVGFSTPLLVPDRPQDIANTTVSVFDQDYPSLLVRIVPGYYSDPSKLTFNWTFISFTEQKLLIRLNLDNPLVVSSIISDPDFLKLTIYGQ